MSTHPPTAGGPALSVILITPRDAAVLDRTIEYLRQQTVRERLEIVIVADAAVCANDALGLDPTRLDAFAGHQVVEVEGMDFSAVPRTAGVRAARAPIIVFGEDHSFPEPAWAEMLLRRHEEPWAAVGPVVRNANPGFLSWSDFLAAYAPWMEPHRGGPADSLPGHNSSYKRDILLDTYGDDLPGWLESEWVLHGDLRERGHRLYVEPGAITNHVNFERPGPWVAIIFHGGWMSAGARAQRWRWPQRLLYAGAAPLIPVVRAWRIARSVRRSGRSTGFLLGVTPGVLLGLAIDAAGQCCGFLRGPGAALPRVARYELDRDTRVGPAHRKELFG